MHALGIGVLICQQGLPAARAFARTTTGNTRHAVITYEFDVTKSITGRQDCNNYPGETMAALIVYGDKGTFVNNAEMITKYLMQ